MSEAYTTARFKEEGRAALAEFFACCFFVFFGAGSVVGALSATGDAGLTCRSGCRSGVAQRRSQRRSGEANPRAHPPLEPGG